MNHSQRSASHDLRFVTFITAKQKPTQPGLVLPPVAISQGGFADIYVTLHPIFGEVAVKRLREDDAALAAEVRRTPRRFAYVLNSGQVFRAETAIWSSLSHRNILPYLASYQQDDFFHIVSPFIQRGTLRRRLENVDDPCTTRESLRIVSTLPILATYKLTLRRAARRRHGSTRIPA